MSTLLWCHQFYQGASGQPGAGLDFTSTESVSLTLCFCLYPCLSTCIGGRRLFDGVAQETEEQNVQLPHLFRWVGVACVLLEGGVMFVCEWVLMMEKTLCVRHLKTGFSQSFIPSVCVLHWVFALTWFVSSLCVCLLSVSPRSKRSQPQWTQLSRQTEK